MAIPQNRRGLATVFHGYFDVKAVAEYDSQLVNVLERSLSYRFYAHYHPFVTELLKRLVETSVSGLLDADTEYATPVQLSNQSQVDLPDGSSVSLAAGVVVIVADHTELKLANGTKAEFLSPVLMNTADGSLIKLAPGEEITLSAKTLVTLTAGKSGTLSNDTKASLPDGKPTPKLFRKTFTADLYNPSSLVAPPFPVEELDFLSGGPYSVYNWELFYHVPLTVAVHLSKNQRFAEAQQWFHYIFDPTDSSDGPAPERFWKVKPLQYSDVTMIEELLINLSTGDDPDLQEQTVNSILAWKDNPFRPHAIARYRQSAYKFKAVMAYLDNLIAWGDSLFREDTGESINEATQIYVLATNILGQRPQLVPKKGSVRPRTYANLRADLDAFGNALVDLEPDVPFDVLPHPNQVSDSNAFGILRSLGNVLYFCIPRNDTLLGYWDTVADRLFKIHNSLNIQGVFRQLPLFEPPIDPALLARAVAAGIDVGAVVAGINQPLPRIRFQFLVQRAAEVCQEVKSLGNNLLSVMEKEDNEALAILRARHERVVMDMVELVRYDQLQEAIKSREALLKSLALAVQRYSYYEKQLGKKIDEIEKAIPELSELDKGSLENMKATLTEPELTPRDIDVDIASDAFSQAVQMLSGGKLLSSYETRESGLLEGAQIASDLANVLNIVSSAAHFVPEFKVHVQPVGLGSTVEYGGREVGDAVGATAAAARAVADRLNFEARRAGRIDSFARREREWAFQSNLAAGEINQIYKQLRAAQIREAIAELELKNHQQQMKHAAEIEQFLNEDGLNKSGKKTNKSFYTWLKREVRGLYGQCFQFAYDVAKKSERALQHELGNPNANFIQFGYMGGNEGLLAGEKLYFDIQRMELAYHELKEREYELTKHVSLLQVDPKALLQLRTTGRSTVVLPEELFDLDCPGHYFRRIKSVALSIPCVTGPYTSINCTLTMLKSSIRNSPLLSDGSYAREGADDIRFSDHFGSLESIVTSAAQNDSGYEGNQRDERYGPFEGSGVVSEWQLELPNEVRQFDYDTIADVILHLRYTAREGGDPLRSGAVNNLKAAIDEAQATGSVRLFGVRRDFPSEWAKFKSIQLGGEIKTAALTVNLREEHYPFWSKGRLGGLKAVDLFVRTTKNAVQVFEKPDGTGNKTSLSKTDTFGGLFVGKLTLPLPAPLGLMTLNFSDNSMDDLWFALTWGK